MWPMTIGVNNLGIKSLFDYPNRPGTLDSREVKHYRSSLRSKLPAWKRLAISRYDFG
jgi:hypothetical protein